MAKDKGKEKASKKPKNRDEAVKDVDKKKKSRKKPKKTVDDVKVVAAQKIADEVLKSRKAGKKRKEAIADAVHTVVGASKSHVEALEEVAQELSAKPEEVARLLRVQDGFELANLDASSTPGFAGGKSEGEVALAASVDEMSQLQERLHAASKAGAKDAVLLVIQGMDTSGKGGVVRHVVGSFDPQGVELTSFKVPTPGEKSKGFLWRIRNALPAAGMIGVFDRSHYEDVLVARVHELVTKQVWSRRYTSINTFEAQSTRRGIRIVKVMLHISPDEQRSRLAERLERPDKHWKYRPGDLDDRARWDEFQDAYQDAVTRCSTENAPWYVVPANKKWYARWAVQQLVLDALRDLDPPWPQAAFDVEAEKERLAEL